jgi:thiamine-monophosphate kinase
MRWRGSARLASAELEFIGALRRHATHPAARGLADDAAVLEFGGARLVITHDTLVEGVHYLASDPPESVAWKLIAVNLSDLAAKGATPRGAMLSYTLHPDRDWNAAFVCGLGRVLTHFDVPLIGGDTVSAPHMTLGATLIGEASGAVPSRSGARAGDGLFVTGVIGDAGIGLAIAKGLASGPEALLNAYHMPQPQLEAGRTVAGFVTAMMDVSDGLLIDALRLAQASDVAARIDLDAVPLSVGARAVAGDSRDARLAAATAGDDYQLLFTSALPLPPLACPVTRIVKWCAAKACNFTIMTAVLRCQNNLDGFTACNDARWRFIGARCTGRGANPRPYF